MNTGKTTISYLTVQQINRAVEKWCDKHFPKYTDEDFSRMARSADIEFLQLCGIVDSRILTNRTRLGNDFCI